MQRSRFHIIVAVVVTVIALALTGALAQQQNPRQLFERARMLDESNQNLTEAIKLYGQVVKQAQDQRALAAKAQLRVGLLYERLGRKAEAQRAFQAVVSQYAEQTDIVRQAQAKLPASLQAKSNTSATGNATGLAIRQVWAGSNVDNEGAPSPDGQFLSYSDMETGDLAVRNLATGEKRRLTNKEKVTGDACQDGCAEESVWSPDGKQLAYGWSSKKDDAGDLRIIGSDGSGGRVLYRIEGDYVEPFGWSLDSKHILVNIPRRKEKTHQIAFISVADGSARVLKTMEHWWSYPWFMRLSPDGRYIAYSSQQREGSPERDIFLLSTDGEREVALIQHPADDFVLGWTPDGKSILFASDRSKTIDAWIIPVADGKPQGPPELVKRDLGKIIMPLGLTRSGSFYYWLPGGGGQTSDIYIATLAPETGKLIGSPVLAKTRFIGGNRGPDWSPDGRHLAYVSWGTVVGDAIKLFILNPETGEEREVRSKFKVFSGPRWSPDGKSLLVRDWKGVTGLYKIDSETGDAVLLVPEKPGSELFVPLLSRDGKAVFYQKNNILWKRNLETGEDKEIYRATPPTKNPSFTGSIALSPDGQRLAFILKQSLFVVPTTGGDARELLKLRESETFPNGGWGRVAWTPDGRYLLFVQPGDKQSELWRVTADGGEPQKLGQLMGRVQSLRIHPDGRRIAFQAKQETKAEVWVMENFLPTAQPRKASVSRR